MNNSKSGTQSSFKSQWAESANSYYFRVDLPGFSRDDIDIKMEQGELKIMAISGSGSFETTEDASDSGSDTSNEDKREADGFQADEFLKKESSSNGTKIRVKSKRNSSEFSSRRFQTSFQVPADKVHISGIHAFMEGESLVVKIPKLKPEDLPSFKIEVLKPKL